MDEAIEFSRIRLGHLDRHRTPEQQRVIYVDDIIEEVLPHVPRLKCKDDRLARLLDGIADSVVADSSGHGRPCVQRPPVRAI